MGKRFVALAEKIVAIMILHIFNPDHELALASDLDYFTPPRVAQRMHSDLGFLPALWAKDGDAVLVDDVDFAEKAYKRVTNRMGKYGSKGAKVTFITRDVLRSLAFDGIDPWGWNAPLRNYLIAKGVPLSALPSLETLSDIRLLSHRSTALRLLGMVRGRGMVGEMKECNSIGDVVSTVEKYGKAVLKAPWSCSGRGVRFVTPDSLGGDNLSGWVRNMLTRQGGLMVEPQYNKVKDFGMEFEALPDGSVSYLGLSLFKTVNGAYTGNILATERAKEEMISRYVPGVMLKRIRTRMASACEKLIAGAYVGHFGVDMMVVARKDKEGFSVHPCVEMNMRRTMGHVALGISPCDDDVHRLMRISVGSNYVLKINSL